MEMGAHSFLKDVESVEEVASPSLPTASARISDGRDPSVSWSDFDALVRKTSALHDRLEQVLEKQQENAKKTSWTEFVSLLSVGEEEGEDANKDATITTLNTSDASSRSDRIIHCQRRDSYVRDQLSDGTITSIHYELPESLFSLIITEDICSVPFFAGMLGAALSVMCLVLVLLDEFSKKVPGNSLGLPAGLHPSVQVAQYLGVIIGE